MYTPRRTELQFKIIFEEDPVPSGVSRISFRGGGFKIFLEKCGYFAPCSAWRSHAFVRGVRGHAPPRKFLKMVQFGAF